MRQERLPFRSVTQFMLVVFAATAAAQAPFGLPFEVRLGQRAGTPVIVDAPDMPAPTAPAPAVISADLLRHPLPAKARQMLQQAQRAADAGDHANAVRLLEGMLAKYPDSSAWAQSLLGVEYMKTDQFTTAVLSFEQAVLLLPRSAVDRSNLGVSLAAVGQYDRAERELRRALELDPDNIKAKQLLEVLIDNGLASR
jgi:tetratricopeptide (TPR) repeat protein